MSRRNRQNTTPPRPGQVEYEIKFVERKLNYINDKYKRYGEKYKESYNIAGGLSILIKKNYLKKRRDRSERSMVFVKDLLEQLQTLYDKVEKTYKTDLERQNSTQGSSKETYEQDNCEDNNDYRYLDLVLTPSPPPSPPPSPQAACAQGQQSPRRNSRDVHNGVSIVDSPSDFGKKNLSSALGQPSVW